MTMFSFYHEDIPQFLADIAAAPHVQRLRNVGMNCGCEYTGFSQFTKISAYSRFDHSVGAGLITWHFTGDRAAAAAALLHDIATPVFAHTVDFLNGDYLLQESTELHTADVICSSPELMKILHKNGLTVKEVGDYHQYPVADNDSPKLSADRLEYSLGNMVNYGFADASSAGQMYADLRVAENETGEDELCFQNFRIAEKFALAALKCSRVYASDEDRYAMQLLSELLAEAFSRGVLARTDLQTTEPEVIQKLKADRYMCEKWGSFRALCRMADPENYPERSRVIPAKKRRIDPFVIGLGRVSALSGEFAAELEDFSKEDFLIPICGI